MRCPKCGMAQPEAAECAHCGLIVNKYRPTLEPRPGFEKPPAPPDPPDPDDPFRRPIRSQLRIVRSVAGALALLFGGWLFLAGINYSLSPFQTLLLLAYGCVGLFWVLSATIKVSVRQFAIEMLIFVFATVTLKVAMPELFELGTLSSGQSGPYYSEPGGNKTNGEQTPQDFTRSASVLVEKARAILSDPSDRGEFRHWSQLSLELRQSYRQMPPGYRSQCEDVYKGVVALDGRLERFRQATTDTLARSAVAASIGELERRLAEMD